MSIIGQIGQLTGQTIKQAHKTRADLTSQDRQEFNQVRDRYGLGNGKTRKDLTPTDRQEFNQQRAQFGLGGKGQQRGSQSGGGSGYAGQQNNQQYPQFTPGPGGAPHEIGPDGNSYSNEPWSDGGGSTTTPPTSPGTWLDDLQPGQPWKSPPGLRPRPQQPWRAPPAPGMGPQGPSIPAPRPSNPGIGPQGPGSRLEPGSQWGQGPKGWQEAQGAQGIPKSWEL